MFSSIFGANPAPVVAGMTGNVNPANRFSAPIIYKPEDLIPRENTGTIEITMDDAQSPQTKPTANEKKKRAPLATMSNIANISPRDAHVSSHYKIMTPADLIPRNPGAPCYSSQYLANTAAKRKVHIQADSNRPGRAATAVKKYTIKKITPADLIPRDDSITRRYKRPSGLSGEGSRSRLNMLSKLRISMLRTEDLSKRLPVLYNHD